MIRSDRCRRQLERVAQVCVVLEGDGGVDGGFEQGRLRRRGGGLVGLIQAMWRRWVWGLVRNRRFLGFSYLSFIFAFVMVWYVMQVARWFGLCRF